MLLKSSSSFVLFLAAFFFVLEKHRKNVQVEANPLFFDSLFPSFQSTTPETVISDYRQRKRADSRAEHLEVDDDPNQTEVKPFSANNVEFYAEIIGKLIGTVRDGVTTLIDDVRQRKSKKINRSENVLSESKSMNQKLNRSNMTKDMNEVHQLSNTSELKLTPAMSEKASEATSTAIDNAMMKEHQEIKLTSSMAQIDEATESNEKRESVETQSANESPTFAWNEVVQVIARRTKHKRSDMSQQQDKDGLDGVTDDDELEFPINLDATDGEMTNERVTSVDGDGDNQQQLPDDETDSRWFAKHKKSLANISENHRRRKEKFIKLLHQFFSPSASDQMQNLTQCVEELKKAGNVDGQTTDDESRLTFAIIRGNSTVITLTPKQFLRSFHRGSDEHAELQMRAKKTLQRAFYKYARLYLLARKGYKDVRNFNRKVKEQHQNDNETASTTHDFLPTAEGYKSLNGFDEVNTFENELTFMTNDGRSNVQAVEALAILILEIFGAMLALTLGAMAHIEAGYGPNFWSLAEL